MYSINAKNRTLMVVGCESGQLYLFDFQSGAQHFLDEKPSQAKIIPEPMESCDPVLITPCPPNSPCAGKLTKWLKYEEAVMSCEFDPLSDAYMLVSLRSGVISLLDVTQPKESCVITVFAKQPAGLRAATFVPSIPGGFVTHSDRAAVLRLWNVSQPSPVALLKVARQSAMHSVAFVPQSTVAVCTLIDGTVIVYDVQAQRRRAAARPAASSHPPPPSVRGWGRLLLLMCCCDLTSPRYLPSPQSQAVGQRGRPHGDHIRLPVLPVAPARPRHLQLRRHRPPVAHGPAGHVHRPHGASAHRPTPTPTPTERPEIP